MVTIAGTVMFYILQTVHVDGTAALLDGIADVLSDCDRGAVGLLVFAFADRKDFAAEQLVF